MPDTPIGPFETEPDTYQAVRAVLGDALDPREPAVLGTAGNLEMLLDAIRSAEVTLGAYDRRIVGWLAGWETSTCAVIAGLITRASAAGKRSTDA